jgi:hypothetical protein
MANFVAHRNGFPSVSGTPEQVSQETDCINTVALRDMESLYDFSLETNNCIHHAQDDSST